MRFLSRLLGAGPGVTTVTTDPLFPSPETDDTVKTLASQLPTFYKNGISLTRDVSPTEGWPDSGWVLTIKYSFWGHTFQWFQGRWNQSPRFRAGASDGTTWTSWSEVLTTASLGDHMPVGSVIHWSGPGSLSKWDVCDGRELDRIVYSVLFAVIGTTYGAGDGVNTFNLPNATYRFILTGGVSSLGLTGGSLDHTHAQTAHVHSIPSSGTLTVNTTGSSHTHVVPNISSSGSHDHVINGQAAGTRVNVGTGAANAARGADFDGHAHGGSTATTGSSHTHTVTDATTSGSGHTHDLAGHSHTGETGTGAAGGATDPTGTGNPPYLYMRAMIKVLP